MLQSLRILSRSSWTLSRSCSSYVARMRHLNKLKEDDNACRVALQSGNIFLYHKLAPLLQRTESGIFQLQILQTSEVEGILEKLGGDKEMVKESILITCNEQNQAQFSLDVGELEQGAVEEQCGGRFIDLRKAFFLLHGPEAPLVARGQALLRWHQSNGFCSATGQSTQRNQSGSQRVCHSSGITYYPKMAPVAIVLVSDGKRCLLGRQSSFPRGMYSALAGFCDMGENLEETLRREVAEEVGLEVESIQYSGSQHWPFPQSSFMVACHAFVNPDKTQLSVDELELEDVRWFTLDEVTAALKIKTPPRNPKGEPPTFWVPPSYAIANRLIREWAANQQLKS
ncbi:nucleoside diphosphate-linked moiety X motif 13 [Hypomesus transpacificus]|uniref:nucleoside diphosphate-linked moiety X motif 13 n=1 Tax=Hypomesus transpacificus TaxID=137520 RepID=UPI001F0858EF|nr:nucleoside diphosphate-linked moiety X motif 13 [Hypomesus transpacificus]XP_046888103.1 nucleoside diphosphate-linked moiety X motif 13 [Hypomesus transpacificus]